MHCWREETPSSPRKKVGGSVAAHILTCPALEDPSIFISPASNLGWGTTHFSPHSLWLLESRTGLPRAWIGQGFGESPVLAMLKHLMTNLWEFSGLFTNL